MTRAHDDLARLLDGDPHGRPPAGAGPAIEALDAARRELEGVVVPRAEFREALRTRLLAVAAVQASVQSAVAAAVRSTPVEPAPARLLDRPHVRRRVAALSGALACVVALTGVGVAASRSVPGELFYAAKRSAESLRLEVAGGGQTEQGLRRLQRATVRLQELEVLAGGRRATALPALSASSSTLPLAAGAVGQEVLDALDDMDEDVRDGSRLMIDGYLAAGDPAPLGVLRDWSVQQAAGLDDLGARLGTGVRPRIEGSLALVRGVELSARQLLDTAPCPDGCAPTPLGPGRPAPSVPRGPAPGAGGSATSVSDGPVGGADELMTPATGGPGARLPGTGPRPTSPLADEDGVPLPLPLPLPTPPADLPPPGSGGPVPPTTAVPSPSPPADGTSPATRPPTGLPTTTPPSEPPTTPPTTTAVPTTTAPTDAVPATRPPRPSASTGTPEPTLPVG